MRKNRSKMIVGLCFPLFSPSIEASDFTSYFNEKTPFEISHSFFGNNESNSGFSSSICTKKLGILNTCISNRIRNSESSSNLTFSSRYKIKSFSFSGRVSKNLLQENVEGRYAVSYQPINSVSLVTNLRSRNNSFSLNNIILNSQIPNIGKFGASVNYDRENNPLFGSIRFQRDNLRTSVSQNFREDLRKIDIGYSIDFGRHNITTDFGSEFNQDRSSPFFFLNWRYQF